MSVTEAQFAGRRSGKLKLGKAVLATRPTAWNFDLRIKRLREIEAIIEHRHGRFVPPTDDALLYLEAAIMTLAGQDPVAWCRRWIPWVIAGDGLSPLVSDQVDAMTARAATRRQMQSADDAAALLALTWVERCALGILTIGACDVTADERAQMARDRKRERDRARREQSRKAAGAMDRQTYEAASLSSTKPWAAMGMSRAKFYRIGLHLVEGETSASPVFSISTRDTPVSRIAPTPVVTTDPGSPARVSLGGAGGPKSPRTLEDVGVNVEAA